MRETELPSRRKSWAARVIFVLWVGSAVAGFAVLAVYQHRAGDGGQAQPIISAAPVMRALMFLHPQCVCSKASVRELERMLAGFEEDGAGPRVQLQVFLFQPEDPTSDEWDGASMLSGLDRFGCVEVRGDPNGEMAASYGVVTSGHLLVYDQQGILRFSGGITQSRGHEGANASASLAAHAILQDSNTAAANRPVFGCPIF